MSDATSIQVEIHCRDTEPADGPKPVSSQRTQAIENEAKSFIIRLANPVPLIVRKRVDEDALADVFAELDIDGSGALSKDEFSAFIVGRFGMKNKAVQKVFNKYDKDHDSTIDMVEFTAFITDLNQAALKFDRAEEEYGHKMRLKINTCAYFTYGCCLCTLCTSCYCGTKAILRLSQEFLDRKATAEERINKSITDHLSFDMSEKMSRYLALKREV